MSGRTDHLRGWSWKCLGVFLLVILWSIPALSGGNDLVLSRLGDCTYQEVNGRQTCVSVTPNVEAFRALTRDLGLVMSPKGFSTAETIGEVGFEYAFEMLFNVIDSSQVGWQETVLDRDPSDLLLTSQFHLRKGLPFSFQLGAVLTHLFDSDMWGLGAELNWSLHEDYLNPVPDLGVRGFVNHTVGNTDLNLTTAGFDAMLGLPVGVGGMVNLTPYLGYNLTAVVSSSRLLDASPGDPYPPMEAGASTPAIKPEFVFDNETNIYHRFLAGIRVRFTVLNFTSELLASTDVITVGLKLGLDI
ncbi:MAG: hypothetical protein JW797_11000 [Bradymonadales bacterium]|nr:hypothetical protein [Bradymonadales bacterium]